MRIYRTERENNALIFEGVMTSVKFQPVLNVKIRYEIFSEEIKCSLEYTKNKNFSSLPRIGFACELDKTFDSVEWLGYGKEQSYVDMHNSNAFGYFSDKVEDQYFHYAKPQENGSHYGTEYMSVTDGTNSVSVYGKFSFSALPYSAMEIAGATHDYLLPESSKTHLSIDYQMRGIGSFSCGPLLKEKYWVDDNGKFSFVLQVK